MPKQDNKKDVTNTNKVRRSYNSYWEDRRQENECDDYKEGSEKPANDKAVQEIISELDGGGGEGGGGIVDERVK